MSKDEVIALQDLAERVATDLSLPRKSVEKTLELFDDGATIPFVARYRKETTGGLDEVQLGQIQERATYVRELEARRCTILDSIAAQGKLTDELRARIVATQSRTELEDLYLPYRPKRRTRATIAREQGLEPLADVIWAQLASLDSDRDALAGQYVSEERGVADTEAAWAGARDICAERISEDADTRAALREHCRTTAQLCAARVGRKKSDEGDAANKFRDYFDFREPLATVPSHRTLAIRRGEAEGALRVFLEVDRDRALGLIRHRAVTNPDAALLDQLELAISDSYDRLLSPSIENDVHRELKQRADEEAIRVFADNLRNLLMTAPLGGRRVLALDPGFRTGCKVIVVDQTGALLTDTVVYPHEPQRRVDEARRVLAKLAVDYTVEAVAVGNGTAGRETLALAQQMRRDGDIPAACLVVSVNESGASVYSAGTVAREEFPDKDITVRGAVSIGRRLQDPLAELVKIDPKSIGVGQYQHDVDQVALKQALDGVVESCVNQVGVEVNTASVQLLSYVAGIGDAMAKRIVGYRAANGPFPSREAIKKVPRLGERTFEQAAGFLRVRSSPHPLDRSAVHPESYDLVERMARDLGVDVSGLVGNKALVAKIDISRYVDERRGEPTIRDILAELEKPGRDPRATFEQVSFRDDVTEIGHLQEGMVLEGVVTNVTAFGAFVDIGVHHDGLVHVSELSHTFIKDPAQVVKVGDRIKVKVISVDLPRRRIGLSVKQTQTPPKGPVRSGKGKAARPAERPVFNQIRFRQR
jgi:protein Tex